MRLQHLSQIFIVALAAGISWLMGCGESRPNPKPPCSQAKLVQRFGPCKQDADCDEGFCDRKKCAYFYQEDYFRYGAACTTEGLPPRPGEEKRSFDIPSDGCMGYICLQGRCRQCTSDAQCSAGSPEYRCMAYPELDGLMRCGDPNEHARNPQAPRPAPNRDPDAPETPVVTSKPPLAISTSSTPQPPAPAPSPSAPPNPCPP